MTVNQHSVGPQLWVGEREPVPERVEPVRRGPAEPAIAKPAGGLWTSPVRENGSSAWIDWMRREYWCPIADPRAWLLTPEENASVYVIDDAADLAPITAPAEDLDLQIPGLSDYRAVDWAGVFDEFDGISLTECGQVATRFTPSGTANLYGWDCATVLWYEWTFADVEYVGEIDILEQEENVI
jgi:hypothetical protein